MDDSVDILSREALQSLGLDPDFLDVSPLDRTDINDTVYQFSLPSPDIDPDFLDASPLDMMDINGTVYQSSPSLPNINQESSEPQGLGQLGSDLAVLPGFEASQGPDQGLLDVQARYLATSCDTKHTDSNISAPFGDQDNTLSPRNRQAPKILVFTTVDGQDKNHQRMRFSDAKRQEVALVRKDGLA